MEKRIIQELSNEICMIYDTLNKVLDNVDEIREEGRSNLLELIHTNNSNVELINKRLNGMDLDIIDNNKTQLIKQDKLSCDIDKQLKEERKKSGMYKIDLTKRLTRFNRENDTNLREKIGLLKVDVKKDNKDKEIIVKIMELEDNITEMGDNFSIYKKEMMNTIQALKREIKIRTKKTEDKKIKGINII